MKTKKNGISNTKAFTLLEVLVTSLISAIVLTGVGLFISQSVTFSNEINMNTKAHASMSLVSRMICDDIKMSEEYVAATAGANKIRLSYYDDTIKDSICTSYFFNSNKLMRKEWEAKDGEPETSGTELIKFAEVEFTDGTFYNEGNFTVRMDFDVTISHKNNTSETGNHIFYAKQRNKVRY